MSDKQPLVGPGGAPSAPPHMAAPPPYQPPAYGSAPPPPPQAYGHHTHVTVAQVRPIESRVIVEVKPPNYLVMSIITMLFFCWIFGLIALIVGMQVDSAWTSGDRLGARRLSVQARGWNIAGIVFGVVTYVGVVIVVVAVNVAGNSY